VRGVRRALRAMRGGLVIGAGCALHGARIVCDTMRCAGWLHSRGALWPMRHSRGAGGTMLLTEGF